MDALVRAAVGNRSTCQGVHVKGTVVLACMSAALVSPFSVPGAQVAVGLAVGFDAPSMPVARVVLVDHRSTELLRRVAG